MKDSHIEQETLAMFAEGTLTAEEAREVASHIAECNRCLAGVRAANENLREERAATHRSRPWLIAAAAAAIALLAAVPLLRRDSSPVARLVELAPRSARVVEPRLTGGFAWAVYRGAVRSSAADADPERLKIAGEAGDLVQRADAEKTAEAQHAAGVALLMADRPAEAARRLELVARETNGAAAWSDLAAARYAAAETAGRAALYPQALAAADQALRIDARHAEALFNRALVLERMGLTGEARQAWLRYLEADPGSAWANEARERLRALPEATLSPAFERDRPLLESAAAARDRPRVRELAARYRQQARTWAEAEYLGRWGEAVANGDPAAAERWLTVAREIGEALHELSGESLLREAVASIDAAPAAVRASIAEGHVLYRRGRLAYSRQQPAIAERDLDRAATHFGSTPMALNARYYAAGTRLAQNDVDGARTRLERSAAEMPPRFIALGGAVRWELARVHAMTDDWSRALPVLTEGAAAYGRAGEPANQSFLESMAAGALGQLGRPDEAWDARIRAFRALSAAGDADLLARGVLSAMTAELRAGRPEAALSLSAIARAVEGTAARPVVVVDTLVKKSLLESSMERVQDARATAAEAGRIAAEIPDAEIRARTLADIAVARAAALVDAEPRAAAGALDGAIAFYRARGVRQALPEPLLLRARCALRLGDRASARRDLDEGIIAAEHRRGAPADGLPSTGVVAAERALFGEAIRLALDEGDASAAFAYAERSRGGAAELAELQRRLARSGVAVLEIAATPRELVTIAVTGAGATAVRTVLTGEQVDALARASTGREPMPALTALYDAIVRPVDAALGGARRIIVVADPSLEGVPFAALYDRGRQQYLVERAAVATASSASSLTVDTEPRRASSVLVVGLPSGAATKGLPQSEREVQDVAALYPEATRVKPTWEAFARAAAGEAGVIHIAGHAERGQGAGDAALLFAGEAGQGVQRVSWKSIGAAPRMKAAVVVLAACETLRRPESANTRALTLAEAFAGAGARDVAGTLVPIADRDARELFRAFHQSLAAGDDAVDALRAVQLDALRGRQSSGFPAWAGIAVLTTRIPSQQ